MGIKLKNLINEADDQWTVKDILVLQKAHERVLKSTKSLQKAVAALDKLSNKNSGKPNGKMFTNDSSNMLKSFNKAIITINVEWMEEPKFKLEDIEINGKDLDRRKYSEYEKMLTKMTGVKVEFFDMYDIVLDGKLEKALKKHGIKLSMSLTDRS